MNAGSAARLYVGTAIIRAIPRGTTAVVVGQKESLAPLGCQLDPHKLNGLSIVIDGDGAPKCPKPLRKVQKTGGKSLTSKVIILLCYSFSNKRRNTQFTLLTDPEPKQYAMFVSSSNQPTASALQKPASSVYSTPKTQ